MTKRVFIDGREGTTGLGIHERLRGRSDVELLEVPAELRKDPIAKKEVMAGADLVVLCLPDLAAVETVSLVTNPNTKVIDASTAHRTSPAWTYGLPELTPEQRLALRSARLVANPGCYATGMLLALRPLVDLGIVPRDYPVTVHAVSGYSGGGKKLIAAFAEHDHSGPSPDWTIRPYAVTLEHKHVPEMRAHALLEHAPIFCPAAGNYYQGMIVQIPLHGRALSGRVSPADVHAALAERYRGERFVTVLPLGGGDLLPQGYLSPTACNGTNDVELFVTGHSDQILLSARLDNLGKGASGAAVQNLNLMLGLEATGLEA